MSEGKQQSTLGWAGNPRSSLCSGEHHYFIACEAIIADEGKVVLLGLCTNCKDPLQLDFKVASPGSQITIEKKENNYVHRSV